MIWAELLSISTNAETLSNNEISCNLHKIMYFQQMLKLPVTLNHPDLERQLEGLLRKLLGRVPFLKVKSFDRVSDVFGSQPDWLVELETGSQPWVLAVEGKRQ